MFFYWTDPRAVLDEKAEGEIVLLGTHLDHLHHAFVLMFYHVAMKHKAPNDFRVGKRNDQFCSTRLSVLHRWNAKRVAQAVKSRRDASTDLKG